MRWIERSGRAGGETLYRKADGKDQEDSGDEDWSDCNDQTRKDDVVTFEQLGVDRLFVDESQAYKNLFLYTKMRKCGGIIHRRTPSEAAICLRSAGIWMRVTGGRGVVFASGTPVSNSMAVRP